MNPIRFGIIGTGRIADNAHAPALSQAEGAVLWSVLSRDGVRATAFAQKHGAQAKGAVHTDITSFLADPDLDAVIITSPDNLHAEHIIACAKAGKHVLAEKPLTVTRQQAHDVVAVCDAANVRLGTGFHLRWHAGHRLLHDLVCNQKKLGTLRHMRLLWTWLAHDNTNWRAHADVGTWWGLAGTGSHCFDMMHWFANGEHGPIVERKSVISRNVWQGPHDETAIVSLRYESGLTVDVTTSVLFDASTRFELYGDQGCAIGDGTLQGTVGKGDGIIRVKGTALDYTPVIPHRAQIEGFVAAIRKSIEPNASGRDGQRVVNDLVAATENFA